MGILRRAQSKVPAVTLGFWIIKVLSTTLGETAGDTVSMTWEMGYLAGTAIFGGALLLLAALQIRANRFRPALYWATIIASTTAGTTLADFVTRSIGIGYPGGSALLLGLVLATLLAWKLATGTVSAFKVSDRRTEAFYWLTITFSQTLGTALGDWTADTNGLGYLGGATLFACALALVAAGWAFTRLSRVALFWAAFILTRPLGATVGDFLDKPLSQGGLDLSRPIASACLLICVITGVILSTRPARKRAGI